MRDPFESEPEAFAFVLVTLAAFAAIAVASLLWGPWAGVPVWAVLTGATVFLYLRRGRRGRPIMSAPAHVGAEDERRILVIADETAADAGVVEQIGRSATGYRAQVLVLCPVHTSAVRHWTSDLDGAIAHARQLLDESLERLRSVGIDARGEIGGDDPFNAIEDALRTFGPDEIIIATRPGEPGVVARARESFALPITHIVTGNGANS